MDRSMINTPMGYAMQVAMSQYGLSEWTGIEHNPEVMKYFHDIGHKWVKDDETAWCAAFVNWVLKYSGFIGTGQLNARSFLKIGRELSLEEAQSGDIVVLYRDDPSSWQGHVGFLAHYDDNQIWILGGNQGNQVNITKYSRSRLLGIRRATEDLMQGEENEFNL